MEGKLARPRGVEGRDVEFNALADDAFKQNRAGADLLWRQNEARIRVKIGD
jgi:hypothetical protein